MWGFLLDIPKLHVLQHHMKIRDHMARFTLAALASTLFGLSACSSDLEKLQKLTPEMMAALPSAAPTQVYFSTSSVLPETLVTAKSPKDCMERIERALRAGIYPQRAGCHAPKLEEAIQYNWVTGGFVVKLGAFDKAIWTPTKN
jgi:hypothetical protein